MKEFTWYAVERDAEDNDWGYGSEDLDEAKRMARDLGPEAQIAVISMYGEDADDASDNGSSECKEIILQEDF